jgi:large subunit ribosomal protein L27
VGLGVDHTIFATVDGVVTFKTGANKRSTVSVMPAMDAAE